MSHPLESWSDMRAFDGTASIVQPLIRPLYDTRTAHQVLASLARRGRAIAATTRARATWQRQARIKGLQFLVAADVAGRRRSPAAPPSPHRGVVELPKLAGAQPGNAVSLVLAPDPSIWDGSVSNNAWLQECPKPLSKQVWGNALHIAEALAQRLKLVDGDVVRLRLPGRHARSAGARSRQAKPRERIETTLGYGRTRAGAIGDGVGFDVNRSARERNRRGPSTMSGRAAPAATRTSC